jgi:N-acetylglutamate synthase-like GNAT family acetyltransferase
MTFKLRKTTEQDQQWIEKLFEEHWAGDCVVTCGRIHKCNELSGLIAERNDRPVGLITFNVEDNAMEITSLNSLVENQGTGTALVERVVELAKSQNIQRLWLVTTNDNLNALCFYQKRGFQIKAVHNDALALARKLKPGIPLKGSHGIPLRDEIELQYLF